MLLSHNSIQLALTASSFTDEQIEQIMKAIRVHNWKTNLSTKIDELTKELQEEWSYGNYTIDQFDEYINENASTLVPYYYKDAVELMFSADIYINEILREYPMNNNIDMG